MGIPTRFVAVLAFVFALLPGAASAGDPAAHTGFSTSFGFGMQNVRGNAFGNRMKPGATLELGIGYRFLPQVALETGYLRGSGQREGSDEPAFFHYLLNLDARYYPLGAGRLEPSVLAGYTHFSTVSFETGPDTSVSLRGFSPKIGVGVRWGFSRRGFVQGDAQYLYTRYTEYYTADDGKWENLPHQLHGDAIVLLGKIGAQF